MPELPEGWSSSWSAGDGVLAIDMTVAPVANFSLERLRIGPVLLDLTVRRHRASLLVRLVHRQGPAVILALRLPAPDPGVVEVDGTALEGRQVRFSFSGRHEVVAYY